MSEAVQEPISTTPSVEGQSLTTFLRRRLPEILLLAVLAVAAYLRFAGLEWDDFTHLHPDERFLTMVETNIRPPESLGLYFVTDESPLNPHNAGHGFFVYGTLPIFIVRYLAEWLGRTGYDQVHLVGRGAAAFFDLLSIVLVYMIGARLYRRSVGLLAAAFASFSVLLIQHAHYFVVDPFANTFILAGFYFAVRVLEDGRFGDYLFFGLTLGMATASKISAAPLAGVIVLAAAARYWNAQGERGAAERGNIPLFLLAAAGASLLAFRLFQPYAFAGSSFFDIRPNPDWLANLAEIRRQSGGEVDFPPALQWVDRTPILFALKNMVLWGMGLPLGILVWVGLVWATWRMARGDWQRHLLPVVWSAGYFAWRAVGFTPAMRYQLPVYPTLILLGAWALVEAWDWAIGLRWTYARLARISVGALGLTVLLATAGYAYAFTQIYVRPVTRVEATRWIYRNVPGPINLVVATETGRVYDPIPAPADLRLTPGTTQAFNFTSHFDGVVTALALPYVRRADTPPESFVLDVELQEADSGARLASSTLEFETSSLSDAPLIVSFLNPPGLQPNIPYRILMELDSEGTLQVQDFVDLEFAIQEEPGSFDLRIPIDPAGITAGEPVEIVFALEQSATLRTATFPAFTSTETASDIPVQLRAQISADGAAQSTGIAEHRFASGLEQPIEIVLNQPLPVQEGLTYSLQIEMMEGISLAIRGSVIISETSWDDGLPLRLEGRDGFGGLYRGVNQELYWPDNQDDDADGVPDKLERIVATLEEGDYLAISSNRQYGSIARVPERYPLSTAYYRALFNCPAPQDVWQCADAATPSELRNSIGYDLVAVFESNPSLGPFELSDQGAEEAFTVYDHPQVFIFAKSSDFDPEPLRALLASVDVRQVRNLPPNELSTSSQTLLLPDSRWQTLRTSGTWNELFDPGALINRSQPLAIVTWWLLLTLIGAAAFPILFTAFSGLADRGYPLTRTVGLLLVSWGSWLLGSLGVPFTALSIAVVLGVVGATSAVFAWRSRDRLRDYLLAQRKEIVWVEVLALAFFIAFLLVRLGNPDLWHPSKGGEKPMDFSYLNAVLKSVSFPPYDPWFAGGYINYYYFGFVFVGAPIKLMGLEPALAYNLVLPTLFSMLALAAYSLASNLVLGVARREPDSNSRVAGLAAALGLAVLGNLGTAKLIYDGLKQIGAPAGQAAGEAFAGMLHAFIGLGRLLTLQQPLPFGIDAWYWDPSRSIPPGPGEPGPITEFPFFTFLYADLHAHMIALPLTVVGLTWALAWLFRMADRDASTKWGDYLASLFIGALVLGALRPTNTWDFPVYLGLGALAVAVGPWLREPGFRWRSIAHSILAAGGLVTLAVLFFLPYALWYGQGYTAADLWEGSRTPISAYLTVHGLFLFVIVGWLFWETRQWMAATPLSALANLRPWFGLMGAGVMVLVATIMGMMFEGVRIALIGLPLVVWAAVLLLRRGTSLQKRFVLTLVAAAVALTLVVEVVVLRGDIGRMNTVFKFYLGVWTMLSVSSGAAVAWILKEQHLWRPDLRTGWNVALGALVFAAALYPATATPAKIRDRMAANAPKTLDGMAFMKQSVRFELGQPIDLSSDFEAIRWMQANVEGSPTIVEANIPEYRWGSRFTIYTGLPSVLGWNWHQRQQRIVAGDAAVTERAIEITDFYVSPSIEAATRFLRTYEVRYVIVGDLERVYYGQIEPCLPTGGPDDPVTCDLSGRPIGMLVPDFAARDCQPRDSGPELRCTTGGLEKFGEMVRQGTLRIVFAGGTTIIYEVVDS